VGAAVAGDLYSRRDRIGGSGGTSNKSKKKGNTNNGKEVFGFGVVRELRVIRPATATPKE